MDRIIVYSIELREGNDLLTTKDNVILFLMLKEVILYTCI